MSFASPAIKRVGKDGRPGTAVASRFVVGLLLTIVATQVLGLDSRIQFDIHKIWMHLNSSLIHTHNPVLKLQSRNSVPRGICIRRVPQL